MVQQQGQGVPQAEQEEEQMTQGGQVDLTLSGRQSQSQVFVVLQGDLTNNEIDVLYGGDGDDLGS